MRLPAAFRFRARGRLVGELASAWVCPRRRRNAAGHSVGRCPTMVLACRGSLFMEGPIGRRLTRILAPRIHPPTLRGPQSPDRQSVAHVAALRPVAAAVKARSASRGAHCQTTDGPYPLVGFAASGPLEQCAGRPPQVRDAGRPDLHRCDSTGFPPGLETFTPEALRPEQRDRPPEPPTVLIQTAWCITDLGFRP